MAMSTCVSKHVSVQVSVYVSACASDRYHFMCINIMFVSVGVSVCVCHTQAVCLFQYMCHYVCLSKLNENLAASDPVGTEHNS